MNELNVQMLAFDIETEKELTSIGFEKTKALLLKREKTDLVDLIVALNSILFKQTNNLQQYKENGEG